MKQTFLLCYKLRACTVPTSFSNMYDLNMSLIFPLTDHEIQIRTTQTFLFELERHVLDNASLVAPYLPNINAHLHNTVLACRAVLSSRECPPFPKKYKTSSGKKIEYQWQFTTTIKRPGRKRKENTL